MADTIDAPVMDAPVTADAAVTAVEAKTAEPVKEPTVAELQAENARIAAALKTANKEAETRRRRLEEIDKAEAEKADAEKTELQKERELREAAEKERDGERRERLLDRVAAKHGLPETMRDRLKGETPEDLEADALELAKLLKPAEPEKPKAPKLDADKGGGLNGAEMTPAREEELNRRFRIK